MQFRVRFYDDADGNEPLLAFLEDLRKRDRILHKLVVAGIKKLEEGIEIKIHDGPDVPPVRNKPDIQLPSTKL